MLPCQIARKILRYKSSLNKQARNKISGKAKARARAMYITLLTGQNRPYDVFSESSAQVASEHRKNKRSSYGTED